MLGLLFALLHFHQLPALLGGITPAHGTVALVPCCKYTGFALSLHTTALVSYRQSHTLHSHLLLHCICAALFLWACASHFYIALIPLVHCASQILPRAWIALFTAQCTPPRIHAVAHIPNLPLACSLACSTLTPRLHLWLELSPCTLRSLPTRLPPQPSLRSHCGSHRAIAPRWPRSRSPPLAPRERERESHSRVEGGGGWGECPAFNAAQIGSREWGG